jgi:hypothetical protein
MLYCKTRSELEVKTGWVTMTVELIKSGAQVCEISKQVYNAYEISP